MRLTVAVLIVLTGSLWGCGNKEQAAWHGHVIHGVMPDLTYDLTDENGDAVHTGAFDGHLRVVFFGYTQCPDVCPTTLARLKTAIEGMPAADQRRIRVLFVSVDPERDSPEQLARYTGYFGPDFIGLTGTPQQLEDLTRRYRVSYGYGKPDDQGFYSVSHSSGVFVFGPDGEARLLFDQDQSPDDIAADLGRLIEITSAS